MAFETYVVIEGLGNSAYRWRSKFEGGCSRDGWASFNSGANILNNKPGADKRSEFLLGQTLLARGLADVNTLLLYWFILEDPRRARRAPPSAPTRRLVDPFWFLTESTRDPSEHKANYQVFSGQLH
ncbi:uncharacterized protein [Triticum aestivum]|uniref:uncharacterized protein n=1 Tax=Triticum aestivum TaxID=4565 RepID=UPI001D017A49|nr:uncharacterized protein LOC123120987 [Triticum aestivum]